MIMPESRKGCISSEKQSWPAGAGAGPIAEMGVCERLGVNEIVAFPAHIGQSVQPAIPRVAFSTGGCEKSKSISFRTMLVAS